MNKLAGSVRDLALLVSGLALLAHETVIAPEPRLHLLVLIAAMLGLPATLRADKLFGSSRQDSPTSSEKDTDSDKD